MDKKTERIANRLEEMDKRLERIDNRLEGIEGSIDRIGKGYEKGFAMMEKSFMEVKKTQEKHTEMLDKLAKK